MSDVKWIKLNVDMFSDEKIQIIEKMPEGSSILLIWIKLITLAGRVNDKGNIYISKNVPYTDAMLSVVFNCSESIIRLALTTFEGFGMIKRSDKTILLVNFDKYQSLDRLQQLKDQNKKRVQKYRSKNKQIEGCNVTVTLPVTQCNGIDKEKEKEREEDKKKDKDIIITNFNNYNNNKSTFSIQDDVKEILKHNYYNGKRVKSVPAWLPKSLENEQKRQIQMAKEIEEVEQRKKILREQTKQLEGRG